MKNNPYYYEINGQLIKKLKPCKPGDHVHITNLKGCFAVQRVTLKYFIVRKHREELMISWDRFHCLEGQGVSDLTMTKRLINDTIDKLSDHIDKLRDMKESLKHH